MKYCSECSTKLERRVPDGDHLSRFICPNCDTVHYQNPKVITGCLPIWGDQVLLCKRAIEPRYGYWTLPAGFLEIGETVAQGAARETMEEAGARVEVGQLFSFINVTYIGQIYMLYLAELTDLDFSAGEESLEVQLLREHEIPWKELAFPTVKLSLEDYFKDRKTGSFQTHTHDLTSPPWSKAGAKPLSNS